MDCLFPHKSHHGVRELDNFLRSQLDYWNTVPQLCFMLLFIKPAVFAEKVLIKVLELSVSGFVDVNKET